MDSSGLLCEKFVKFVTRNDTSKNEMRIPSDFCSKYGNRLPASFHVILRNGYRLPVDFDQRRGILKGFLWFFNHFDLKGGEMLLFEYYGRYDLNVYIIGTNCSEIEYPHIVHHLQTCHPRRVTLGNGGWRFVFFVIPLYRLLMRYRQTGKISCLRTMCDVLGLADLKPFHMLLFTYDGVGMVNVSVFDENLFEVVFPGSPTSIDETSPAFDIASIFEITIQSCHMLKYCYGVDISTEYKDLCDMWDRIDYINVYSGDSSWRLQVRKRSDWNRTTINDASLDGHSKAFVDKVDEMIKEVDEHSAIWKGKLTEMKKQAEHIMAQRRNLASQLLDFKNNI
ncbi:hypothetical protein POM88_009725 [Heracleum sosnowskyi]|uniref:Uncharacterized protein n=1 Tax=Heracleum sosnowskyi TaxID=360622 RepID=A0AAD8J8V0_9APIA|nr:hypothetical protein POM88_009725 [Heracleum sosnowskyi]